MESLPRVSDHMDTQVPTLSPDLHVLDAIDYLLDKQRTGAPVVDESGTLVGIFTERDGMNLLVTDHPSRRTSATVSEFMTSPVDTVNPSVDIYYAAGLFIKKGFRRLIVVDDGKVVGAITRFDLLRAIRGNREYWKPPTAG